MVASEPLFPGTRYYQHELFAQYDVHPDGDRFVVLRFPEYETVMRSGVVIQATNWLEELRLRMGRTEEP